MIDRIRSHAGRADRRGFTLIELLVVISIIILLAGLLIPVIGMIRRKAAATVSQERVLSLSIAMRSYADEDPRRFFPTPAADQRLIYDPAGGTDSGVLNLLEASGYRVSVGTLAGQPGQARPMVDGWGRALRYHLDGPFLDSSGGIDASRMNATADRPGPQDDWNPTGKEPFAYIWSLGLPAGDEASDAAATNSDAWIHVAGAP